eukprot:169590-Chlamydomonas_euryale.AAC.1
MDGVQKEGRVERGEGCGKSDVWNGGLRCKGRAACCMLCSPLAHRRARPHIHSTHAFDTCLQHMPATDAYGMCLRNVPTKRATTCAYTQNNQTHASGTPHRTCTQDMSVTHALCVCHVQELTAGVAKAGGRAG